MKRNKLVRYKFSIFSIITLFSLSLAIALFIVKEKEINRRKETEQTLTKMIIKKEKIEKEIDIEMVNFDELLRRSDIISLNFPYSAETHHLISAAELATMKDGVYIVNTARGKIIDQKALIVALKEGKVAGAALDVFEEEPLDAGNPLISMDNVILTPHLAASSEEAMMRMAVQVSEGVLKVLRGEIPDHPVLF